MRIRFNEAKVTQAAAYLLKLRGGRMKYLKLIKLLYLADREALTNCGRPISTDRYVSMDHGPVLSTTLNLINGSYRETDNTWASNIASADDYDVVLIHPDNEVGTDELSRAEITILDAIFAQYGHMNRWTLIDDVMHKLPEWQNPNGSAFPIDYKDILEAGGLSPADRELIEEDLESLSAAQDILASYTR